MNAKDTVTITADMENNAETFWNNFRIEFPDLAMLLGAGNTITVNRKKWEKIKKISGFCDGPDYAREAIIEVQ